MASLKSELLGSNLSKSWLWQTGDTIWISDMWRRSRCSAPPATGPSLQAAPLTQSVGPAHPSRGSPSGFLSILLSPFTLGLPPANSPKLRIRLDAQSEPVEVSLPLLKPRGSRLVCGGDGRRGCEATQVFSPASHPQLTGMREWVALG